MENHKYTILCLIHIRFHILSSIFSCNFKSRKSILRSTGGIPSVIDISGIRSLGNVCSLICLCYIYLHILLNCPVSTCSSHCNICPSCRFTGNLPIIIHRCYCAVIGRIFDCRYNSICRNRLYLQLAFLPCFQRKLFFNADIPGSLSNYYHDFGNIFAGTVGATGNRNFSLFERNHLSISRHICNIIIRGRIRNSFSKLFRFQCQVRISGNLHLSPVILKGYCLCFIIYIHHAAYGFFVFFSSDPGISSLFPLYNTTFNGHAFRFVAAPFKAGWLQFHIITVNIHSFGLSCFDLHHPIRHIIFFCCLYLTAWISQQSHQK